MKAHSTKKSGRHATLSYPFYAIVGLITFSVYFSEAYGQSCPNVDFSSGTFANWQGRTGTCCPINLPTPGFVAGRHTIINTPGADANTGGGLILPAPGFTSVARLGNPVNGAEAEGLSYTLIVDASNALFIYTYAVVLEDPGHSVIEQPRFELQVRDQFNNIIPCTFYEVAAGAGIPGFQTYGGVVWQDWRQVGVDLTAYMGQPVTIEARTGDCSLGGHYGYGYLVGECNPLTINLDFCLGATSATLTAPDGFSAYLWSTGETTQDITISNPTLGQVVTCNITSVTGCEAVLTTTLNPVIVTGNITSTNVTCLGGNNGSATVSPSGGVGGYTYSWAPSGGTAATANNLSAGTYTVTINENSNNCTGTATVTITEPATAVSATGIPTNVNCFGTNTGAIDLTPAGGNPGYTYTWSNGTTTQDISSLTVGTYSVMVTDAFGCTTTFSQNITQPATLAINTGTISNVSCFGGNNGTIDINITGGTVLYNQLWSNGSTNEDPVGLAAGPYAVTVTDAFGCTATYNTVVTQPPVISLAGVATNINCFGGNTGAIDLIPSGGVGGFTYNWNNGAVTQDVSGLTTGTYSVIVTDANNCTSTFSAGITQPAAAINVTGTVTNINCFGGSTGAINITPSGGVGVYSYLWSNGATTQDLSGIPAGTYAVTVTDLNGCTNNSFSATLTEPAAALTVTGTSTQVFCFGANTGAINITPAGGTLSYSYLWSNGATTQDLSGIPVGNYSVLITDANGCTNSAYSTTISQPATAVSVSGISNNINCFGGNTGAVDLTPAGGTPGYIYNWSNGATTQDLSGLTTGTYSVLVTDANNCTATFSAGITQPASALNVTGTSTNINCFGGSTGSINITPSGGTGIYGYVWSNGATTQDLSGIPAGNYNVTVTDLNGCTNNSFSVSITQPAAAVSITGVHTNVLCFSGNSGSVDITPAGGTPGYTYLWNNGASTQDLSNLSAGNYSVLVTDANGCTNSSFAVTITQPAAGLAVSGTSTNNPCYGFHNGTVNITVTGGTPAYTYAWSNGGFTEDLANLGAGTYSLLVTDANGCTNSNFSATVYQPLSALIVNGNATNPHCNGTATGSIDVTASGGTPPYEYSWNTGGTTEDVNNANSGDYTVTVIDGNGCTVNGTWGIVDPQAITITPFTQPVSCDGIHDAAISLSIIGGSTPYNILWNTGSINPSLNHLAPGNYSVTVTDAGGCTSSGSYSIAPTVPIYVNLDSIYSIWLGESVELNAVASGGVGTLSYSWNPPEHILCPTCPSTEASPILNTNYAVTVTDENGCTAVAGAFIEIMFAMYIPNTFTPNGDGDNDLFYAISGSVKKFNMRIFDRWGEEVFTTSDIHTGWNGEYRGGESKQDVYVFRIEVTFMNGKYEEVVGQVNLLR
jgi:gliding motility-associated-like protein